MDRREFFQLVEGGGTRKQKAMRKGQVAGRFAPLVKREELGEHPSKVGAQMLGHEKREGIHNVALRVTRPARRAVTGAVSNGLSFIHKTAKKVVKKGGEIAGGAMQGAERVGRKAVRAIKANPKKALAAAAIGTAGTAAGLMFMRKKPKKDKRK